MQSLFARLAAHAAAQPGAPACIDGARTLAYRDLLEGAEAAAAWLWRKGVRPGETVALAFDAPGPARGLELLYGLARLGVAVLPLPPDAPPAALRPLARRYGARRIVSSRHADYRAAGPGAPPRGDDDAARPFFHMLSSGTTGTPKAVLFTQGQLAAAVAAMAAALGWDARRVVFGRPWPERVALRTALRVLYAGGAMVQAPFPRSRGELARLMREQGVTSLFAAPSAMRPLLREGAGERLEPLRVLCVGGEPCPAAEIVALREQITPQTLVVYAASEAGVISVLRPQDRPQGEGDVGHLIPGMQARSVGGRLAVRAPWMPQGYAANPRASAAQYRDGWFYSGDLGAVDADGRVTLRGRADDVVNFRGVKIYPQDVDPVLARHPDIAEAALVGVPDPQAGELPVSFLVVRRPLERAALVEYCKRHLGLRRPMRFVLVRKLPRNAAGKVDRKRLVARYRKLAAAAPRRAG